MVESTQSIPHWCLVSLAWLRERNGHIFLNIRCLLNITEAVQLEAWSRGIFLLNLLCLVFSTFRNKLLHTTFLTEVGVFRCGDLNLWTFRCESITISLDHLHINLPLACFYALLDYEFNLGTALTTCMLRYCQKHLLWRWNLGWTMNFSATSVQHFYKVLRAFPPQHHWKCFPDLMASSPYVMRKKVTVYCHERSLWETLKIWKKELSRRIEETHYSFLLAIAQ